jgi:hypothetical protein
MTSPTNLVASLHQRLLNQAHQSGRPFNELLQYYAIERFLYRLAQSPHRDRFVLKGALIFTAWGAPLSRPTRDVDLLAYTGNTVENVTVIVQEICRQAVEPDGMVFDPETVTGDTIKEQAEYQGIRTRFLAHLGRARVNMQIDMGFADVVSPRPELVDYPSLLQMPRPRLKGYSRESVVAEKAHALVVLGMINSRMKDFYDLWLLARKFDFDGAVLAKAIANTFAQRDTPLPFELPDGLKDEFSLAKQGQWRAFAQTATMADAPRELTEVLVILREFLWPVLTAALPNQPRIGLWKAPGPWA